MNAIFEQLSDWIEDRVRDRNLRWIGSGSGILTITLAWLGYSNIAPFGLWPSLLLALSLLILAVFVLGISRRYMRRQLTESQQILSRYGQRVQSMQENNRLLFDIRKWEEEVTIGRRGDAEIQRDLTIRAGDESVPAIWSLTIRNSDRHLSPSIRQKVSVTAYYLGPGKSEGSRIVTTHKWEGRKLRAFLHFPRDLDPKSEVTIRLRIKWPRYASDMLDGTPEDMHWTFRRRMEKFESTLVFEKSFTSREIRASAFQQTTKMKLTPGDTRRDPTKIHLSIKNAEVDKTYGYNVSLESA